MKRMCTLQNDRNFEIETWYHKIEYLRAKEKMARISITTGSEGNLELLIGY